MKKQKIWYRKCPKCGKEIIYTTYVGQWGANKNNSKCSKCKMTTKIDGPFERVCLNCKNIIRYNTNWELNRALKNNCCIKCRKIGKYHTEETKNKIRNSKLNNSKKEETSKKMRISAINRIIDRCGICHPNFNLNACKYFDYLEKEKMWNGMYATKNKEHCIKCLGYFVDYYEPTLNIVVEYDEPRHFSKGKLKIKDIKDIKRMNEIKNVLKCKFYRYNEYLKELKEF